MIYCSVMKINLIAYKSKHYIFQDADLKQDPMSPIDDYVIGVTTKEQILRNYTFINEHKEMCNYYGIPYYIGSDKELKKVFPN